MFAWAVLTPKGRVQQELQKRIEEQKSVPDIALIGVTFSESSGDTKFWEIVSTASHINKDTGEARLEDVQGLFYDRNKPVLHFSSPAAQWNLKSKKILLKEPTGFEVTGPAPAGPKEAVQQPGSFQFVAEKSLIWSLDDQDRKSTRLNSSHSAKSRMPSSA